MTSKKHLEVELKLYIRDQEEVAARLVSAGATRQVPRVFERNIRYDNHERSLVNQGIVIRLRQDMRTRLTYKEPVEQSDDLALSRFEAEVEVSDLDTMEIILERLGYIPAMIYEKYRTTYELNQTEIVIDEMPFGVFIEIEGTPDAIRWVIDRIGLQDAPRFKSSYAQLFYHVREKMGLDFRDLTFDNFEGIEVPAAVFEADSDN